MGIRHSRAALVALVLVSLCASVAVAEDMVDVVYLKNGSVVRGLILEQIPGETLKIKTADGSIFVFAMGEVEKIVKEPAARSEAAKPATMEAVPLAPFCLIVNPLGFAQFGPMVMGELRMKENIMITPWIRFHALGVLSSVVAATEGETVSIDPTSLGLGVGIMRYVPKNEGLRGWHFGGALEYGWIDTLHAEGESWEWRTSNAQVAVVTNIGYRWRMPPMAFVLGGIAGAAYTFKSEWWYTKDYKGDSSVHTSSPSVFPFAMLEVAIGVDF